MFDLIWRWLHEPGNLDILKVMGGFFATVIGAAWTFLTYLQNRTLKQQNNRLEALAHELETPLPTTAHSKDVALEKPVQVGKPAVSRAAAVSLSLALIVTIVGVIYALLGINEVSGTVTNTYRVCIGEYERNCGFPHDVYMYCYEDPAKWAAPRCLRYSASVIGSHDGNKCGYTNVEILCTQKKP